MEKIENSYAVLTTAVFSNSLTDWLSNGVLKQDLLDA